MPLIELHEEDRPSEPVFVNPEFVTFVQKSPTSQGAIVGLIGDDLGCVVKESAREVADRVNNFDKIEIVPQPAELHIETEVDRLRKARPNMYGVVKLKSEGQKTEVDEVRKQRKVRKWHSRKPFNKEAKSENDND